MIIFKPPLPVYGAPNLNKGIQVYSAIVEHYDRVIELNFDDLETTINELSKLHNPKLVSDIMEGNSVNGYFNTDEASNVHSVASCKIMKAAIQLAYKMKTAVFAPVSGFHHSGYNFVGGYCTFNGLIYAANEVRKLKHDARILIIDGDGHFGDGTEDFVVRGIWWIDNCSLSKLSTAGNVEKAKNILNTKLRERKWDLVIYQAGADCHYQDPYLVGYLNDEEWVERDKIIFEYCKDNKIPLVFNLAGGYNGPKTLELHISTVNTAKETYK